MIDEKRRNRIILKIVFMVSYLLVWYQAARLWSWLHTERGELVASAPFLLLVVLLLTDYELAEK